MSAGKCPVCRSDEFDPVFDVPAGVIEFDKVFKRPILAEKKTSTLRHDFDKDIGPGDVVILRTSSGEDFAYAKVTSVMEITAGVAVNSEFSGHTNYDSMEELALSLRTYYPGVYFSEDTPLTFISFSVIQKAN